MSIQLILIIVFSVLFTLTHLLLSHGSIRAGLVVRLGGEWRFRGFYSLVSFLTLVPGAVIWWGNRHLGPILWEVSPLIERVIALPMMLFSVVLLVLSLATPSPASMVPGSVEPRGVLRITRHPMNMAFVLFGLAHMLANGSLGDVFFFGQFVAVGLLGSYHQDARKLREKGETYREFEAQTSVIPFVAIIRGRTRFEASELAFPMFFVGVVAFVLLAVFHGKLFGVDLF